MQVRQCSRHCRKWRTRYGTASAQAVAPRRLELLVLLDVPTLFIATGHRAGFILRGVPDLVLGAAEREVHQRYFAAAVARSGKRRNKGILKCDLEVNLLRFA